METENKKIKYRLNIDEAKIKRLRADGMTPKEIAGRLGINTMMVSRVLNNNRSAPKIRRCPNCGFDLIKKEDKKV